MTLINDLFSGSAKENGFLKGMRPAEGFGFACGAGARPEAEIQYGLLPEFGALRYGGRIRNVGATVSGNVRELHMACLSFALEHTGQPTVHGACGGPDDRCYPPASFRRFAVSPLAGGSAEFGSSEGLSSNETLPFFVVSDERGTCGFFLGFGWSGNWKARFSVVEDEQGNREFTVRAWLPSLDASLRPGESIPVPEVLLGFYAGTPEDGMNALRRTLRKCIAPAPPAGLPFPPVVYGTWFGNGGCRGAERLNEQSLARQADIAAELGCEVFEIDLGWEAGSEDIASFDDRRIDWEPSPSKFPHSLGAFAVSVRARGMQFGLWFDVARTTRASRVALDHPDWVLWRDGDSPVGVVNFGLPEAREWAFLTVAGIVERYGVRWVRMDYNLNPAQHWARNDEPGRAGLTEIRHVEGYYAFLDRLMERFPGLCIEQCAAGGRMIDLGTIRRGHMVFLCDMTSSAVLCRYHLSGAGAFLPSAMLDRNLADWCEVYTDAQFLSRFGGAFGVSDNVPAWPRETVEKAKTMIALYKGIRSKLTGDFHALFPQPQSLDGWDGWQFHGETDSSGIFFLFRTKSKQTEMAVKLHAIGSDKEYAVVNLLSGKTETIRGFELASQGYSASLDYDGACVWSYQAMN